MEEAEAPAYGEDEQRPIPGLDPGYPDVEVPQGARAGDEAAYLPRLAEVGLYRLYAFEGVGQDGVELAEGLALRVRGGIEAAVVFPYRDDEEADEDAGDQKQSRIDEGDHDEGYHRRQAGIHDDGKARREHQVEEVDVVRGPGHDVADALARMEGLALSEQVREELGPRVALDALGEDLEGDVAAYPRDSLNGGRPGDEEGDRGELGDLPAGLGEHVEALADEDLEPRIADIVRDREEGSHGGKPWIAQEMRDDPSAGAAEIVANLLARAEFGDVCVTHCRQMYSDEATGG